MGGKNNQILRLAFVLLLFLVACEKDKPNPSVSTPVTSGKDVYVVCEGSLGNGNAGLSLYNPKEAKSYEDIYASANGEGIGDVLQSITRIGEQFFLCVNNSNKVVVMNRSNQKLVTTISIPYPRYILSINATKAYVSTLFSDKVYIINPATYQVTGSFSMPYQNPEGMLLYNNSAYICTWDTACGKLFKVNTVTDKVEQEITIAGRAPQSVLKDANNKLWILAGNVYKGKQSSLTCIDPADGHTEKSFLFQGKADAIRPVFNAAGNTLYFIEVDYNGGTEHNGIYKMNISDNVLPAQPFVAAQQYQYFWALGVHPTTNQVYIGDPKGFIQKGSVYVYDANGNKATQFDVGIGPGQFYFEE